MTESGAKPRSYSDMAYERLRRRILTLDYLPSSRLDDYQISAEFECSRTPVREAIFRLVAEGWVDVIPKVGFIVRALSVEQIAQLFEAHLILSAIVARLAAERIEDDEISQMERVATEIQKAVSSGDRLTMTAKNTEFHHIEARATRNDILAQQMSAIHDQSERLAYLCYGGNLSNPAADDDLAQHVKKVQQDHSDIIDALTRRDATACEEVAVRHVRLFRSRVRSYLVRETELDIGAIVAGSQQGSFL